MSFLSVSKMAFNAFVVGGALLATTSFVILGTAHPAEAKKGGGPSASFSVDTPRHPLSGDGGTSWSNTKVRIDFNGGSSRVENTGPYGDIEGTEITPYGNYSYEGYRHRGHRRIWLKDNGYNGNEYNGNSDSPYGGNFRHHKFVPTPPDPQ